jgi:WD40 repeat protein
MDREYRTEFAANPGAGANPYMIPPLLHWILLIVCVLGTTLWLVLATDGAVLAPLLRRLHVDKLSMGYTLFLCVLVEDIPHVILTCVIIDCFGEDGQINDFALMTVVASLDDTLIKLAEAFDERMDVVETGVWCKQSLWAHNKTVTAVIPLRIAAQKDTTLPSDSRKSLTLITDKSICTEKVSRKTFLGYSGPVLCLACVEPGVAFLSGSQDGMACPWSLEQSNCLRIFIGHTGPVTTIDVVDPVTFLTGSNDTTIKIWDAFSAGCIRTYAGHMKGVTCVGTAENGTLISAPEDRTIKLGVLMVVSPIVHAAETLHDILGTHDV